MRLLLCPYTNVTLQIKKVIADTSNPSSLRDMACSTRVVITTTGNILHRNLFIPSLIIGTGPFDRYGSDLVKFCAGRYQQIHMKGLHNITVLFRYFCLENGTHYGDITGETDWVRKMIDLYDGAARESGARIIHFCGHDCVPWDLAGSYYRNCSRAYVS